MVVVLGHYDGQNVILDGPVPDGTVPNARVRIVFETSAQSESLASIAASAVPGGLPPDYARQHEHYVKGVPRR